MPTRKEREESLSADRMRKMSVVQQQQYHTRRRAREMQRRMNTYHKYVDCANLNMPMIGGVRDSRTGNMIGGIHTEAGAFLGAQKQVHRVRVERDKKPTTNDRWCAIEIEFVAVGDWGAVVDGLVAEKLGTYCHLKEDGSVAGSGERENEYELVVCAKLDEMPSIIRRVCKVLHAPEIDAGVNKTCGLHVHLDMRHDDVDTAYRNLVYGYESLLSKLVPKTRVDNDYCKPPETSDFEDAEQAGDRYRAVNPMSYNKHKTLEVRIFGGSVRAEKIIQYLNIVVAIAYAGKGVTRSLVKAKDWEKALKWEPTLTGWVQERALEFGHSL